MKKIAFKRPDGGLSIINPTINTHPVSEGITEDQALERAWKDVPPDAINPIVVDDAPSDRSYRNAWTHDGSAIVHDMIKARELHKDILRARRAPKLADLDIAYQRADEDGDSAKKQTIAAQKRALRDVTKDPAIEAARSIDDLKIIGLGNLALGWLI